MLKFFFILLIGFFFVGTPRVGAEPLQCNVNAESVILMNADTGVILYERNAREPFYPASTTKIATALVALKAKGNKLDDVITISSEALATTTEEAKRRSNYTLPPYWLETGGSHMGLKKGEEMTLRDLLYGMMLVSANDAANVIALHVGKTIPNFMTNVNAYLRQIGCKATTFSNPHGFFHPNHKTTAYDMAVMTKEALKNPTFCEIVSTSTYLRPKTNKQEAQTLIQTNKLLRNGKFYYPYAIGVKTGHLSKAGNCFVSAARRNGRTLIAVLLKTKERTDMFQDAVKLFEAAFNQTEVKQTVLQNGPQKAAVDVPGAAAPLKAYIKESVTLTYFPAEEPKVKCFLYWNEKIVPPIAKDQLVGEIRVQAGDGRVLAIAPLFALEKVDVTWNYWFKSLFGK